MSAKVAFWFLYGGFGIILVYTDYIWAAYPTSPKLKNHYEHYLESNTSVYQKVHLYGNIPPELKVVFSAYLHTDEPRCIKHPRARYASVRVIYPEIISGQYNIDIFKDYTDKQNNCKYKLAILDVYLYKKDIVIEEVNGEILNQAFSSEALYFSNPNLQNEAIIMCSKQRRWDTDSQNFTNYISCKLLPNNDSPKLEQSMKLDINITGDILGLPGKSLKKRSAISDVMQKFQIFGYRIL